MQQHSDGQAIRRPACLGPDGRAWFDNGANLLRASGTTGTVFHGRSGADQFLGSSQDDTFDGGPGTDRSLGMGSGVDTCVSVEVLDEADCENITP